MARGTRMDRADWATRQHAAGSPISTTKGNQYIDDSTGIGWTRVEGGSWVEDLWKIDSGYLKNTDESNGISLTSDDDIVLNALNGVEISIADRFYILGASNSSSDIDNRFTFYNNGSGNSNFSVSAVNTGFTLSGIFDVYGQNINLSSGTNTDPDSVKIESPSGGIEVSAANRIYVNSTSATDTAIDINAPNGGLDIDIGGVFDFNSTANSASDINNTIAVSNTGAGEGNLTLTSDNFLVYAPESIKIYTGGGGLLVDTSGPQKTVIWNEMSSAYVEINAATGTKIGWNDTNELASSEKYQLALGNYSRTQWQGQVVNASDSLDSSADTFTQTLVNQTLILDTASTAHAEMFIDAVGTESLELEVGEHCFFKIRILGVALMGTSDDATIGYEVSIVANRDGVGTYIDSSAVTVIAATGNASTIAIVLPPEVDILDNHIRIMTGGVPSYSYPFRWVASIDGPMIKYTVV